MGEKPKMKKLNLLIIVLFTFLSSYSFAGLFTLDVGYNYSHIAYDGDKFFETTNPIFGFTIGGTTPGFHGRMRINGSTRDFKMNMPAATAQHDFVTEQSYSLKGVVGVQYILKPIFYNVKLFFFAGLQYRISEVKMKNTLKNPAGSSNKPVEGYTGAFGYKRFHRLSVPLSVGLFYPISKVFVFQIEAEADFIPLIYSQYTYILEEGYYEDLVGSAQYNEYSFMIYFQVGFKY